MQTVFRSSIIFAFWIVSIIHVTHAEKCDNPSEGHGLASSGLSSDDKVSETEEKHLLSQRVIRSDDTHHSFLNEGSAAISVELVFLVNVLKCDVHEPWPVSLPGGCASEGDKNVSKNFVKDVVAGLPVGNATTDVRVAVLQIEGILKCREAITLGDGTSHSEINKAVDQMGFYDRDVTFQQSTWGCISHMYQGHETWARRFPKKVLVVLSNQGFNHLFNSEDYSSKTKRKGLDIMAIGVGPEIQWQDQVGFNTETYESDRAFLVPSFEKLTDIKEKIIRMICEKANCPMNGS